MLIALLLLSCLIYGQKTGKIAVFPELNKPCTFIIDEGRIYFSDGPGILIYSLKDFKLIRKFGKEGEGPGEFKLSTGTNQVDLYVLPRYLQVNSPGKISFFTKEGKFKKEIKQSFTIYCKPLNSGFVGARLVYDKDNTLHRRITVYDSDLNKVKEFFKEKEIFQPREKTLEAPFWAYDSTRTWENKIFIDGREKSIHVFNKKGKRIQDIKLNCKRIKVTDDIKKKYLKYYEEAPLWRSRWNLVKDWFVFPEFLPVIRYFLIKDKKIYIFTYQRKNGENELLTLDIKGKLLKQTFLPVLEYNVLSLSPLTISNDKLYQLHENEAEEMWELYVTEIKD